MKNKNQKGVCPKCGNPDIIYGSYDVDGDNVCYEYECEKCNDTGLEWYKLNFVEIKSHE